MEAAPLLLGFILGPMLEENFRRAMLLSRGSFNVFVNRPISGTLLAMIGTLVVWQIVVFARKLWKSPDHVIHAGGEAPVTPLAAATAVPATGGK
jgi:putative tricarboxylic transport membrane protein